MRSKTVTAALFAMLATLGVLVAGCSSGNDAVAQGDTFPFVSPGGQTTITYPESDRKPIADLVGPDLVTDQQVDVDKDFAGKVTVINVWGSWCGPCRAEADDLETVYEQNKDKGVAFVGINLRDDRQSAKDFVADRKVGYPSIYDFDGATLASMTTPTSVVPTTVVLDSKHRPAAVYLRTVSAEELGAMVSKTAAEDHGKQP